MQQETKVNIALFRLIASGQVDSKSWNRKVDSIPRVEIDHSIRFLELESKPDSKNRPKSSRLLIK